MSNKTNDKKSHDAEFKIDRDEIQSTLTELAKSQMGKAEPKRIVDLYDRDEIGSHLQQYLVHAIAKGINPEIPVVLDWLYSSKRFNERDDFVKIERLIEMVKQGQIFPSLILEVLEYAKKVEDAALKVVDETESIDHGFKSIDNLKEVLDVRLEVRRQEEEANRQNGSQINPIAALQAAGIR